MKHNAQTAHQVITVQEEELALPGFVMLGIIVPLSPHPNENFHALQDFILPIKALSLNLNVEAVNQATTVQ
jgi:hypothetical protein